MLVLLKKYIIIGSLVILGAIWTGPRDMALSAENEKAPAKSMDITAMKSAKAVFPQRTYTFEPVMEGVAIKHDFIVENHGEGVLEIKGIRPD